mgnify:FL=1
MWEPITTAAGVAGEFRVDGRFIIVRSGDVEKRAEIRASDPAALARIVLSEIRKA